MDRQSFLIQLKEKHEPEYYAGLAKQDDTVLPLLFDLLTNEKSAVKYLCEKTVRLLSETEPLLLYPYFEQMCVQLDSENRFIKWGFLLSIPNLLAVDEAGKWNAVEEQYLSFLETDELPAFGNTVLSLPKILEAHPELEDVVIPKLLSVDSHVFYHKGEPSPQCRSVAAGHILDCFYRLYETSSYQKEMLAFAAGKLEDARGGIRSRAKKLIKKYNS